jgi:hypothetical protein
LIVSGNQKFHVSIKSRKRDREETQTHGYEIDLVGARQDALVLASVKSFFGSRGVSRHGFRDLSEIADPPSDRQHKAFNLYKIFNEPELRTKIIEEAARRYGYSDDQVELRLYVGRFGNELDRRDITAHLKTVRAGKGSIRVVALDEIVRSLFSVLESKTYINDPVISTLKALAEASRHVGGDEGRQLSPKAAMRRLRQHFGIDPDPS